MRAQPLSGPSGTMPRPPVDESWSGNCSASAPAFPARVRFNATQCGLAALRMSAMQANRATLEHDHGLGVTALAERGMGRIGDLRADVLLFTSGGQILALRPLPELAAFFLDQPPSFRAETRIMDQADGLEVILDHRPDLGHDRGHVLAARLEVAAARIEDRFISSTRKVTSPPLRNTALMILVSATIHWK